MLRRCATYHDRRSGNCSMASIVNGFTEHERFPGAIAVLSDLGEPDHPFRTIEGQTFGRSFADAKLLRRWRRSRWR
jgi:hypothetical protein